MSGWGLAGGNSGSRSSRKHDHFWALKQRGCGDLLSSRQDPKIALIAAYLAADVDVRVGTCWRQFRFSVLGGSTTIFGRLSSGVGGLAIQWTGPQNNTNLRAFAGARCC